jgi:1,4-dihydroxy-2-naphthoate octaprenyltransferase
MRTLPSFGGPCSSAKLIKMSGKPLRSVITCDLEGRIQTYDQGAEVIFGYSAEEVVGKQRVSLFSPGLVVLGQVGEWLKAATKDGTFDTRTVFLRKGGTPFAARIRITPTYKRGDGKKIQIGYCGLTEPLPEVSVEEAMPPISLGTRILRWLVITRAPFLTATLMPVLMATAWVGWRYAPEPFPWMLFVSALIGAASLHVSANTFNDYFDWTSGTDALNVDYFTPYTGGSRSIELGLISERGLFGVAVSALVLSVLAAGPILYAQGHEVLAFGAAGAFLAYFYTAPPIRLAARRGLGELSVGLAFGPLLVAGCVFAFTGKVDVLDFIVGIPLGLLTAAILLINEFPDARADALAGKNHLVVTLGRSGSRWLYAATVGLGFALAVALVMVGVFPVGALAMLLAVPVATRAIAVLFARYRDRELVEANAATIKLHLAAGLLLTTGIVLSHWF